MIVHDRANWTIDWKFLPIYTKTGKLGIEVRVVTALEKRIVRESNARYHVSSAESNLLSLSEVLVNILVEFQLANISDWKKLFGPELGSVQYVKVKFILATFRANLNAEVPFWIYALVDGCVQILAMEVGILPSDLQSLIPDKRMYPKSWCEVKFDKVSNSLGIGKGVGIDSETLHHTVRSWNTSVTHSPHEP
jgi:hypothetical protein